MKKILSILIIVPCVLGSSGCTDYDNVRDDLYRGSRRYALWPSLKLWSYDRGN